MKRIYALALIASIGMLLSAKTFASVTIKAATDGSCLNVTPGGYSTLSNIILTEAVTTDFAVQAGTTFILNAPAGFEFLAGAGSVSYTAGMDITAASMIVTTTSITVTITVPTTGALDVLKIKNIQIRALLPNALGKILRPVAGGTAVIAGDAPGAGVNHGTVTGTGLGAVITTLASGDWSNAATWVGGVVPSCNDVVVINHSVVTDMTASVNDITINSGGRLTTDNAITVSNTFNINGTGTYVHNNTTDAASTVFAGIETFSATSTIKIQKWSDRTIPLASSVNGDFGNVTFAYTGSWDQDGMFAPAKIKGTLTVESGTITLDDGTGMTTALTLQDVLVTAAGNLFIQTGTPRNLDLVTGNFTDNSTASGLTAVMYKSIGDFSWTVNGNLDISHKFSMMEGVVAGDAGTCDVTIIGNFLITNGQFDGMKSVTGPMTMNVTGNTVISGTPTYVYIKKNFDGNLNFTTNNLTVTGGATNYMFGPSNPTGIANVTVNNDMTVSGAATKFWINYAISNTNATSLTVFHDATITDAEFTVANHLGDVAISVSNDLTMSGASSIIYGQRSTVATGDADLTVNGSLTLSDGQFIQSRGLGSSSTDVTETISLSNASYYALNSTTSGNNGISSLTCSDINLNGGKFYLHRSQVTDGRTVTVNITNDVIVNFLSASDEFAFIGRASGNNAQLDLNIGGSLFISGNTGAFFTTSVCTGLETVDITGDINISGGQVRFNGNENISSSGHILTGNVGGSFTLSGGNVCLSYNLGNVTWDITGDFDQSGGYVFHRNNNGAMTVTVNGNYTMTGGQLTMYARSNILSTTNQTLQIMGNASFANSTVMFDSCQTSTATHRIIFKGPRVTMGDNTLFTHIKHLTAANVFGQIIYDRAGTITWSRLTSNYDIQQVNQSITSSTVVDASSSANDFKIASHSSSSAAIHTTLTVQGALNMGTNMIIARDESGYNARAYFDNNSRLITANTGGLYSGTAANSCIYPLISGNTGMDYYLSPTSTVEYNGADTQIITGTGTGIATTTNHRYGYLDINFQGTPDVEFAYPYDNNVYIRTGLVLTAGELNLDDDHVTATGGRTLNILNGATVSRTAGYVRSEVEDGTGAVSWNITTTGSFVFPFGYNSSNYIPFTFQVTSGSADDVLLATYRSAADNTPYPPTISHVNDLVGVNNSPYTVDRFWRIEATGSTNANMLFNFTASEGAGVSNPRAQLWEPVSSGWYPPSASQSNPTTTSTQTNNNSTFNSWWTLSSSASPLPIQLVAFDADRFDQEVRLTWSTASEINNDYFTVQRSGTGDQFTDIATIQGAGNSSTLLKYGTIDNNPLPGINYYRLKQTDFNGDFSYSNVKVVSVSKGITVTVFPNPFRGSSVQVAFGDVGGESITADLYDMAGQKIATTIINGETAASGIATIEFDKPLAPGPYMMELKTKNGSYHQRILKQ